MNPTRAKVRVWAIVPAAGRGKRMGGPKQALPFSGSTLAGTVVRTLVGAGVAGVVVVTRSELADGLELPDDPRVQIAFNDADSEMIDSIRIGLARVAGDAVRAKEQANTNDTAPPSGTPAPLRSAAIQDGIIVVPADMPLLSVGVCKKCTDAYKADPRRIVIATYSSRRGHPIVFPLSMKPEIDELPGGLNELPRRYTKRIHSVVVADPGVVRDIDTLSEYEELSG